MDAKCITILAFIYNKDKLPKHDSLAKGAGYVLHGKNNNFISKRRAVGA